MDTAIIAEPITVAPLTEVRKRDKYDEAVEYLTAHPTEILGAWHLREHAEGKILFQYARATPFSSAQCGCLTMIRSNPQTGALGPDGKFDSLITSAIKDDTRIPTDPEKINAADLPVFAEWHRRLDKLWGRT
jgi:hypothetical protein